MQAWPEDVPSDGEEEPEVRPAWLALASHAGAAAQAIVPGLYAWAVTVAPGAWSRGGSSVSKVASVVALLALAAGAMTPASWRARAAPASLWGFVLGCAVSWSATPAALHPARLDVGQGLAGMLGWALFALAAAAPALEAPRSPERLTEGPELVARRRAARGEVVYLAGGLALAAALQGFGWRTPVPERALLVRLVGIAAGLAVIGASVDLSVARLARRGGLPWRRRLRRAALPLVTLGLALLAGAVLGAR